MRNYWLALVLAAALPGAAHPQILAPPTASPGLMCRAAVVAAERGSGIPRGLLGAISRVESGRRDPISGAAHPWPWTANAEGQGYFFDTKADALVAIRAMQARGIRSIDVGCAQVNLMHHPNAFATLEAALDPVTNVAYAARFLKDLFAQSGDWNKATGMYHSATPDLGAEYQRKVMAVLPEEQQLVGLVGAAAPLTPSWSAAATPPPPIGGLIRITRMANAGAAPRMIMLPTIGGETPPGRGLDAYRAAPITLAFQPPPRLAGR